MSLRLLIFVSLLFSIGLTFAQEETASISTALTPSDFAMRVVVDSMNIRALPTTDSDRIGSLFEGDNVYAVGRNIDGTWFEIQRPSRDTSAGWVSRNYFSYMFDATQLPITDLTTGLIGETPVVDTGVSAFILTESALRTQPNLNGARIVDMQVQRTIPVLSKTPDNLWVKVNYLGDVGWVAEFLLNVPQGIAAVPIDDEFANAPLAPVAIIPPEVQRAQAHRMIAYATPIQAVAQDVANFWSQLTLGLTIPCNPPASDFATFSVTQQDLFELPELRTANRLIPTAINDLNTSIEMMRRCGVYTPEEISRAYARAINASAILSNSIDRMEFTLEEIIGS